MSAFEEKVRTLVQRLQHNSDIGTLEWTATDRPGAFLTHVGNQDLMIASRDDDGVAPFTLLVYSGSTLVDEFEGGANGLQGYELEELYRSVRRSVSGVNTVLDAILQDLPPDPEEPPF